MINDIITGLQFLYPSGRAWNYVRGLTKGDSVVFVDGFGNPFVDGLGNYFISSSELKGSNSAVFLSNAKALESAYKMFYDILKQRLPDNEFFDIEDIENWERVLGLIQNNSLSETVRKERILSKQSYYIEELGQRELIEKRLRENGFDVYVHENRFANEPIETQVGIAECGTTECGGYTVFEGDYIYKTPEPYTEICANYINLDIDNKLLETEIGSQCGVVECGFQCIEDQIFDNDSFNESVFFVCGENYPDKANITLSRREEFRQLLLTLKPITDIALIYANYI